MMSTAMLALFGILLLSAVIAAWLSRRKIAEKPVKIMLFVGYFWFLTFLQLSLFALLYFLLQRLSPQWIS